MLVPLGLGLRVVPLGVWNGPCHLLHPKFTWQTLIKKTSFVVCLFSCTVPCRTTTRTKVVSGICLKLKSLPNWVLKSDSSARCKQQGGTISAYSDTVVLGQVTRSSISHEVFGCEKMTALDLSHTHESSFWLNRTPRHMKIRVSHR